MGSLSSGRRGLSGEVVSRVKRLVEANWPKTRIADELQIHRATVHKIANGSHSECQRSPQPRCPGCGAKVAQFPCLLCQQLGRPCEPETRVQGSEVRVQQTRTSDLSRHRPLRPRRPVPPRRLTMSQLAKQLRDKAAELETRAAALREEADREEAKASQLTQSAEILAAEPEPVAAAKKAPPKPPAAKGS